MISCSHMDADTEICVNTDCPMCAGFCPVAEFPGVCRFDDRGQERKQ